MQSENGGLDPETLQRDATLSTPSPPASWGIGAIVLGLIALSLYWRLAIANGLLNRWEAIGNDMQVALPPLSRFIHEATDNTTLLIVAVLVWFVIGVVLFAGTRRSSKGLRVWAIGTLLVAVACLLVVELSHRQLDAWLAREGDAIPPLTTARIDRELGILESRAPQSERQQAAQVVRLIGLKHAVGLLHVEEDAVRRLIAIAVNDEVEDWARFGAAWALMPIDHRSRPACDAIHTAAQSALKSDDPALRELAEAYREHPCVREEASPAPEQQRGI